MGKRYYAGIGARNTPQHVLDRMYEIGEIMAEEGWILRSGGAEGADSAFEEAVLDSGFECEIYIPWKGFNGHTSKLYNLPLMHKAYAIAEHVHTSWNSCSEGAKRLLARNVFQIMGSDFKKPSEIVIGWRDPDARGGGTAFAYSLASYFFVPVLDMGKYDVSRVSAKEFYERAMEMVEIEKVRSLPYSSEKNEEPVPVMAR